MDALAKVRRNWGANWRRNGRGQNSREPNFEKTLDLSSSPILSVSLSSKQAGPGPEPRPDEDCYICLRPIGTKNLFTEKAGFSGGGAGAKKTFETNDDGGENENENAESDQDAREKGGFSGGPKGQLRHTGDDDESSQHQQHERHEEQQHRRRQQQQQQNQSNTPVKPKTPRAILRLPCGHRYCDCCLRRWLSRHSSCPTCRWSFPERDCEVVAKEF